jgi:ATP-dependent exoDNAse (exonuclease V) beta subunit
MRLSASSIKEGRECLVKTHWKYILKEKGEPQSIHALFGSTLHDLIRLAFKYKQFEKSNFFEHYWKIMFEEDFCEQAVKLETESLIIQNFYLEGDRILKGFKDSILMRGWNNIKILEIEDYFRVKITEDLTFSGYIDLVFEKDNQTYLVDWKSNRYAMSQNEVDESIQLTMYYYAMHNKNVDIDYLGLYFLRHNRFVTTVRNKKDTYKLLTNGIELKEQLDQDILLANMSKENCKWCEYKSKCKAYIKKKPLKYDKIKEVFYVL